MNETTISAVEPAMILPLFGARDQHLRRIRQKFNVEITHRNGSIKIKGDEDDVSQASQVLEHLKRIVERRGSLTPELFEATISQVTGEPQPAPTGSVEILQTGRQVRPKTQGQADYVEAMRSHEIVFAIGPAGTGKTYLAVAMAVEALKHRAIRKIVLVRPAVEAGESLGFLPGDMQAKINPYLRPLLDAIHEMVGFEQIQELIAQDIIEVIPLAYMRGRTLNDAFIILDEAQNSTIAQMKMFLTRMGQNSKIVVSGDPTQTDLPPNTTSGLRDALNRLSRISGVKVARLSDADIVRHRLVQQIVAAYESKKGVPVDSSKSKASRASKNGDGADDSRKREE